MKKDTQPVSVELMHDISRTENSQWTIRLSCSHYPVDQYTTVTEEQEKFLTFVCDKDKAKEKALAYCRKRYAMEGFTDDVDIHHFDLSPNRDSAVCTHSVGTFQEYYRTESGEIEERKDIYHVREYRQLAFRSFKTLLEALEYYNFRVDNEGLKETTANGWTPESVVQQLAEGGHTLEGVRLLDAVDGAKHGFRDMTVDEQPQGLRDLTEDEIREQLAGDDAEMHLRGEHEFHQQQTA